jgi:hypothetical protein
MVFPAAALSPFAKRSTSVDYRYGWEGGSTRQKTTEESALKIQQNYETSHSILRISVDG